MPKTKPPISYTSRDFESIKSELVNYVKVYYPDTYKDFNNSSFGSMMIDMVAYVGDVLSYYLDYQVNESFVETALQQNSILKSAKQLGYKLPGYPSSTGICSFFVAVPAQTNGGQPNVDLLPILKNGTTMTSDSGASFILAEDVDFNKAGLEVIVGDVSETGAPINYIYKSYGRVVSGENRVKTFTIGEYIKFRSIDLGDTNVTEIISITDSDGNEYYEVEYLSQDTIYKSIKNTGTDSATVPYILKKFQTFRRYTTEFDIDGNCKIQFGGGAEADLIEESYADPSATILQFYGKNYNSDILFDPNQLIRSEKLGISPVNTTITVHYRANPDSNANVPIGSIKTITNPIIDFRTTLYSANEALS